MLTQIYRVNMYPETCPSDICSMGCFYSEYEAEKAIEKYKKEYSDTMVFEIETDYIG